jgi:diaminohydroxyphosphoribosylaminopyrimidine deaminase/5-amino-6-(5-phosphoribosylamino)uracil reductase
MATKADRQYMARALELAAKGRGKTSPNPMVGAIVVNRGKVIGEGYHQALGKAHAEVVALKKAGSKARGATLYVTLEPCCHTGRTGPCTDVILAAGISRVVYASKDPDPRVSGKGAATLRRSGIEVVNGVLKKETTKLNEGYFAFHQLGRPFIIAKTAQTLDGKIATSSGQSKWITGRESRRFAHRLRSEVDAVIIGSTTVTKDDPELTVRLVRGSNPYRIILSANLSFPMDSRLITVNDDYKTIIATSTSSARRLTRKKISRTPIIWSLRLDQSGLVDPADFVERAADFGLRSLLIEGGGKVIGSFLRAGLIDKLLVFTAPKVLGGGIDAITDLGIRQLDRAVKLERMQVETSGGDLIISGYPAVEK